MREMNFEQELKNFIAVSSPENALKVVSSCKGFVVKQAAQWRNENLGHFEKIREIMAEMFLILLEDFDSVKGCRVQSILSYLNLRLRRLTRPAKRKTFAFGPGDDFADQGRCDFSPFRLQLVQEIVAAVRQVLAGQNEEKAGLLEFLFIHIFPEVAWASRLIARYYGEDEEKRHAADKKRHQRFNQELKKAFANLPSGDWHEVLDWSPGERSHLAWRLIDISLAEISNVEAKNLEILAKWREEFSRNKDYQCDEIKLASEIFQALKQHWQVDHIEETVEWHAAEPSATYGEEPDLISILLGSKPTGADCRQNMVAEENSTDYQVVKSNPGIDSGAANFDADFDKAAHEIAQWLEKILAGKKGS
jgi:hypothetical protein